MISFHDPFPILTSEMAIAPNAGNGDAAVVPEIPIEWIETKSAQPCLIWDGMAYTRNHAPNKKGIEIWRCIECTRLKCKVTIKVQTTGEGDSVTRSPIGSPPALKPSAYL